MTLRPETVVRLLIIWRRSPESCLPGPCVPRALPLCSQAEVSMGALHRAPQGAVLLWGLVPGSRRWLRVLTPDLRVEGLFLPRLSARSAVLSAPGSQAVLGAPSSCMPLLPTFLPLGPESRWAPSLHSLLPPPEPSCHPAPPDTQAPGRRLCPCVHSPDHLSTCSDCTVLVLDGCPGEPGALGMAALTWFVSWSPTSHQHCSELLGI